VADSLPFRLTNRVVNPVLRRLLRTRAGRVLGRRLAVLRYTGARTGRPHELVTMYVRTGDTAWIVVGQPEHKSWWRNLRTPAEVTLWLAGEQVDARAVTVEGDRQAAECRRGLSVYLAGFPAAARSLGVRDRSDPEQLTDAAARAVMVRADLRPGAPPDR
jgi:deazaflavin-dependent oxidoreductase (nitroreductase family)